jgi:hypothetical protein
MALPWYSKGRLYFAACTWGGRDPQIAAHRAGAVTHRDQPEASTRDRGIESASLVGDPKPQARAVALQREVHLSNTTVARDVRDSLAGDAHERIFLLGRGLETGNEIQVQPQVESFRHLGCRLGERNFNRLFGWRGKSAYHPPRLTLRSLYRLSQAAEIFLAGFRITGIEVACQIG